MTLPSTVQKQDELKKLLLGYQSVLIAFSGGADSTYLAKVAFDTLGRNAVAVTAVSETYTRAELITVRELTRQWGMEHVLIDTNELANPDFNTNPQERCYFCKKELFIRLKELAERSNIPYIIEGSNADDLQDHRPGRRAIEEYGIKSPLLEVGLTKAEIRELSRQLGLPTYNKPAQACLASRIPYGQTITAEKLQQVEQAEEFIYSLFPEQQPFQLRVRHFGDTACIETEPCLIEKLFGRHRELVPVFQRLGFNEVKIDPRGYRMGSLNQSSNVEVRSTNEMPNFKCQITNWRNRDL
jgi:uncharacterized protein